MIEEDRCGLYQYRRYSGRRVTKNPDMVINNGKYFDSIGVRNDGQLIFMTVPKSKVGRYKLRYRY